MIGTKKLAVIGLLVITITPEFPEGTYAYFMTEAWPVVPRMYRGTPSADFRHGPGR